MSHVCPRVHKLHALLSTFRSCSDLQIDLQFPPPSDATWTNWHEIAGETQLPFHTTYDQARQSPKCQQKRQHALYNAIVHRPTNTESQMVILHNPLTPQRLSPELHSFWRGPYKITQVISGMIYKICEIEPNRESIVHYDRMKLCRSPPGGSVPPTNTPPTPMQPPKEIPFKSSTSKCHYSFCGIHITCTPTVDPVPVSSCQVRSQQFNHHRIPLLTSPTVANDKPPESSAPLEEETFLHRSPDSTLP